MGAQWKQAGRVANATKRGQVIGKLVREIMVAAKLGGPDPDLNARLYAALEAARKASVPRDTIERAVKKGAGQTGEKVNYDRSEEHTSELQSQSNLVCRLLLEKKKKKDEKTRY